MVEGEEPGEIQEISASSVYQSVAVEFIKFESKESVCDGEREALCYVRNVREGGNGGGGKREQAGREYMTGCRRKRRARGERWEFELELYVFGATQMQSTMMA